MVAVGDDLDDGIAAEFDQRYGQEFDGVLQLERAVLAGEDPGVALGRVVGGVAD